MAHRQIKLSGIDIHDTLRVEKADAIKAMWELLMHRPIDVREKFERQIRDAKTSGEIAVIMKDVRDQI
jgi:hypothetical protein